MSTRHTAVRSLHDLGAAAWFGGSLMGLVGVNGAAAAVADSTDRTRVSAAGWGKLVPVNAAAIGAHLLGGAVILWRNRGRAAHQSGVTANTVAKLAVTGAALGATAWSGVLGATVAAGGAQPAHGATEPAAGTRADVAAAQQQLKYVQWVLPVLTGAIVVLTAQQGEQQRAEQIVRGATRTIARRARR